MARFRYRYAAVEPPAPSVLLNLANPTTGVNVSDVPGLVDTGADQTVLPARVAQTLGLPKADQELICGFDGIPQLLPTVVVRLQVRDFPPIDLTAIVSDQIGHAILGRDVLNRYRVILDGPNSALEISDE